MVYLPQNEPNPNDRKARLTEQKQRYQYDYSKLDDYPKLKPKRFALLKEVPPADESFTKGAWIKGALSLGLRIRSNQGLQDLETLGQFRRAVFYLFWSLLIADPKRVDDWKRFFSKFSPLLNWLFRLRNKLAKRSQSSDADPDPIQSLWNKFRIKRLLIAIRDNQSQRAVQELHARATSTIAVGDQSFSDFQTQIQPYNDLFQIVYLPEISKYFQYDHAFAAQRVAGANPLVIERVMQQLPANLPLSDEQYKQVMGTADSLADAIAQGRLYLADYKILETIPTPTKFYVDKEETEYVTKYGYAPLALFAVPAGMGDQRTLVPVAIQCGQDPNQYPIFTPQSGQWDWLIAKTIVQIADGNHHELISHLGRTHFLLEAFAISTPRQLADNHPLHRLLTPHFEGTLFINDSALRGLVNKGGTVDKVLFGTLEDSLVLSVWSVRGAPESPFQFNDLMLPKALKARGVDDVNALPIYPYRDDALDLWFAIHAWVKDYLELYYKTDADIQNDSELQAWFRELIATGERGGQVVGFGETSDDGQLYLRTKAYLIEAVTLIIFTASAQHAAVNFSQAPYMTYGPNMPLAGYLANVGKKAGATAADYLALLPPLSQADAQMSMTYVLGSVYYTKLGDYPQGYFNDALVAPVLEKFQQKLQDIEKKIEARNETCPSYYDALLPNKIPQSINI